MIPRIRSARSNRGPSVSARPIVAGDAPRSALRSGTRLLVAAILVAVGATACADNDLTEYTLNQPSTGGKGKAPELIDLREQSRVEIVVTDNVFTPRHIMISPGTTVVWVNEGRNSHNVMPSEGDEFNKTDLPVGGQIEITFDQLGTIPYYCTIHGSKHRGQTGTIIVA